jgi:hypothetical protein
MLAVIMVTTVQAVMAEHDMSIGVAATRIGKLIYSGDVARGWRELGDYSLC